MFCYKIFYSNQPILSQVNRAEVASSSPDVLEINHVTIGCLYLLSKETGWYIRSGVYADVEKSVNTETGVKVVYKRTLQPVSTLLVRNKFYIPKPCFCVCRACSPPKASGSIVKSDIMSTL